MKVYSVTYEARVDGSIGEFSPFTVDVVVPDNSSELEIYTIALRHLSKCGIEPRFPISQTYKGEI